MARIPDEYRQYMSKMNDMVVGGFTFKNCPDSWRNQWGDTFYIRSYPAENYSFFTTARNGGSNISVFSFKNNDGMSPINLQASAKLTLNVTGSENSCTGIVEHITDINIAHKGSTNYQYIDLKVNSDWSCTIYSGSSYGNISTPTNDITLTQTGTLAEVLDYFSTRLRNVDVYVNGVPWDDVVTYNWQSVPSISGKNGILSLVTLDSESINDGEPVSGAAVSVFDQAPSNGNNIKNLADTYGGGEESSAVDVTVKYKVTLPPGGSFSTLKIVAKKDSIPENVSDGDKIVDISPSKTKKTVTGLDENSLYYFKIFGEDTNSNTSESDEKHIMTSGDEGWSFDYTGSIQTFTAPKTGIYQLETWGAQGGDATDGTNTARGGYGAYAVGEVLLQQGDTLYINVGGQNGYGGGGFNTLELDAFLQFKGTDISTRVFCGVSSGTMFDASNCAEATQSGELLSNKLLYAQGEGVTPTIDTQNKEVRYPANPDGNTRPYSVNLIPINRNTDAHYIKCTAVRTTDVSANYRTAYFELSVYYVENGELKVGTNTYIQNPTVDAEIEMLLDVSSLSYIDYIGFGSTKDAWTIKDIVIDMS